MLNAQTAAQNLTRQAQTPAQGSRAPQLTTPHYGPYLSPTGPMAAARQNAQIAAARQQQIDLWLRDNAHAEDSFGPIRYDAAGGERVSKALNGDSPLGALSAAEQRYLIDSAAHEWRQRGASENLREATENLRDADTRAIVAEVYAEPSAADQRHYAEGGTLLSTAELQAAKHESLQLAIKLDPAAVVRAYEGVEGALGDSTGSMEPALRQRLLETVAGGQVNGGSDGTSKLVTALFLRSSAQDFTQYQYREQMAGALAQIMVNREGAANPQALAADIEALRDRYNSILATPGGRSLLADDKIVPDLRGWAMAEIASNPSWNAAALKDGWSSPVVSSSYANSVVERYQARGVEPQVLKGEALRNTIGQALGITPDRLPAAGESAAATQGRLEAGLNHQYYGPNPRIDAIAERIRQLGGDAAAVTIMPVTVTSDEFGAATFNVFKIQGSDGKTYFVDDMSPTRHYEGFEDWRANNRLPPGQMTYVADMEWGPANSCPRLTTEATPLVTDTFGEWAREIGDGVALVAGIAAGAVLIVGTGGTGAVLVAGAAGLYTAGRAGEELYDAHRHGVDVSDLSNAEVRAQWLDLAAGTLSFGAMGAARFATLARQSGTASSLQQGVAGLQLAANTADAAAATNQAHQLASHWGSLSNGERAMGLLNLAFWGGMTAAGTRASGAQPADAYSFVRLSNHLQFGAPYPVRHSDALPPGRMQVVYDTGANGRASNIRIEYGGAAPDPAALALHSRSARQMEASGNLLDRVRSHLSGGETAPVGSAAWEAQFELNKIGAEARAISEALAAPNLSAAERAKLSLRLDELETATVTEAERLTQLEQQGEGWVAAPSRGAQMAADLGWPDPPDGYVWVAGAGEPHLRRLDVSDSTRLYYNADTNSFTESAGKTPMQRTGHGTNEVEWHTDTQGRTTEVTATLREFFTHAERSRAELNDQNTARANGHSGDHAGHIIGHRFVLDRGLRNLFPQDANLNTGAYKTLENELADWIAAGCDVNISVQLHNYQNGRPTEIEVEYDVIDTQSGKLIHTRAVLFNNDGNQAFTRVDSVEINQKVNDVRER